MLHDTPEGFSVFAISLEEVGYVDREEQGAD